MENEIHIKRSTIVLVVLQFLFVVIMAVGLRVILTPKKVELAIGVDDIEKQIDGIDENGKEMISYYIYQAVAQSADENSIVKTGAIIRDGSVVNLNLEDVGVRYVNFIVDLPEMKQSYQVFYEWNIDKEKENDDSDASVNEGIGVTCLEKDQLIYGDFDCRESGVSTRMGMVNFMLAKYGYRLPQRNDINARPDDLMNLAESKVRINYINCGTQCECVRVGEDERLQAVAAFEEFIKWMGFRIDTIPSYFYNCENESF